jgi:hypothetical protein
MKSNPFNQPMPKQGILLKVKLWPAKPDGKDSSAGVTIKAVATHHTIWFGRELSVPLAWISEVSSEGPGIKVTWHNELTGASEVAFFCIRTMFGYNKKKTQALVSSLKNLVEEARSVGPMPSTAMASEDPRCQVCGDPADIQLDFTWIISILLYFSSRPDRRLLCRRHAKRRFIIGMVTNTVLASLGIPGMVLGPYFNYSQGKTGRHLGIISAPSHILFVVASLVPVTLVLGTVAFAIVKMT